MNGMSDAVRYLYAFALCFGFYAVGMTGALLTGYWELTWAHALWTLPVWFAAGQFWGYGERLHKKEQSRIVPPEA